LETAEVQSLSKLISNMEKDIENCEEYKDRIQLYKAVSSTISLKLRKNEALTKLEDRMFLSPAARVKSVPKKVVKETAAPSRMAELRQKRGE